MLNFCKEQRGDIIRIGIIDGYPWATKKNANNIINEKTVVQVQESEYDIISALLLNDYFSSFL